MSDIRPRDRCKFTAVFDGLDMVDPGVALISQWRPDDAADDLDPSLIAIWGGIGPKP